MFFFESRKTKFFFLPFVCHLPFAKKRERKKNKKREATKIKNLGRKKPPLKIRDDDDDDDDDFERLLDEETSLFATKKRALHLPSSPGWRTTRTVSERGESHRL